MYRLDLFRRKGKSIASLMPYGMIIDVKGTGVVINKNGSFMTVWKYRGPDLDSALQEHLAIITAQLNSALMVLGSGWVIYMEAQRLPDATYDKDVCFPDAVTKLIDDVRRDNFTSGRFFRSEYYFSLCWLPPSDNEGRLKSMLIEGHDEHTLTVEENLQDFMEMADSLCRIFKELEIPAKLLDDKGLATYLHSCVSDNRRVIKPPKDEFCDSYLYDADLIGGNAPKLGEKHLKIVVPKAYPKSSVFGMLNNLNRLNFPYRWVTRFYLLDKTEAISKLDTRKTRWKGKMEYFSSTVKRLIFNSPPQASDINENAVEKVEEVQEALRSVDAGDVGYGYYSTEVIIAEKNYERACLYAKAVEDVFKSQMMKPKIEDVGAVDAWLGSLPGNFHHYCRRIYASTGNLIHMMPLSDIWSGQKRNEHLSGPALIYTHSDGATPFRMNLHVGDVGHTLIVGPTGAGKSVQLNMISAQFRKYKDAQVFIFDKGGSSRILTEAVGGRYFELASSRNGLSFQPLAGIDDDDERMWAVGWITDYLESVHVEVTPEMSKYISEALSSMKALPKEHRTMLTLCTSIQNLELKTALRPLTIEGDYGSIFDASADDLDFSSWQVFEMESLMNNTPKIVGTTLLYIFHRIEEEIKKDDRPCLLVLDESWVFLDNPQFASKIREWLKVLRKSNTAVVFATQSLADIVASPIVATILESCPTRIFLPNKDALDDTRTGSDKPSMKEMYQSFGLNEQQIMMLAKAIPKREYYYTSPLGNRIYSLDLSPMELALVGVKTEDIRMAERIIAEHGRQNFAVDWLRYKGLEKYASRLETIMTEGGELSVKENPYDAIGTDAFAGQSI
ncbi:type IV secretion system protein VirB4 [Selenomonas ruminantium]|uniref:Type IV secretion system protein VirB4 n=2 Tax=Selenomonas ruminantium TaxID=971 RepID=A0A1I0V3H7_SELRU|nr:type IV secretion system protein VirB4 [Selenomonas ruminantium]